MCKTQVTYVENPQMKINSLEKQKYGYLIHTRSDKPFKGTIVNRVLPSLVITFQSLKELMKL